MIPFNFKEAMASGVTITGTRGCTKTTLAKHIAQFIKNAGISVYVIDVSKAWNTNTPMQQIIEITDITQDWEIKRTSATIDISRLGFLERFAFTNSFVKKIYTQHVSGEYRWPEFVFFEECHTYLPSGCFRSPRKYADMIDFVTVGRNFDLSYGLITQFPAMTDTNPLKATQQRYFGWTTEENDVAKVRSYFPRKLRNDYEEKLRSLGKGNFLYQHGNEIVPFAIEYYKEAPPINSAVKTTNSGYNAQFNYEYKQLTV